MARHKGIETLAEFLSENASVVVLSGAGVSTASGIPDYRDHEGEWKHAEPMQYGEFRSSASARKRYWARSYVGWRHFSRARPKAPHLALAELESLGKIDLLVTQNVDGLHQRAGSRKVVELHGNLGKVRCVDCDEKQERDRFQESLRLANPDWHADVFRYEPDGDAVLAEDSYRNFSVPDCPGCGGTIKPDVVMFGESVPQVRVRRALAAIDRSSALLIVGSSLMVFSGFRFARHASAARKPIAIVNQGRTRADDMATLKVSHDCGTALSAVLQNLSA